MELNYMKIIKQLWDMNNKRPGARRLGGTGFGGPRLDQLLLDVRHVFVCNRPEPKN